MRFNDLKALVPTAPDWSIDWSAIWGLWPEFSALDECPQDPIYHAEGDVGTHTRMVVEALVADPEWRGLIRMERALLFWAACFHDIGKPPVTKHEDGRITSRGHSRRGAHMARSILRGVGDVHLNWREALCEIIVQHQTPFWILGDENPDRAAIKSTVLVPGQLLTIHARADVRGRRGEGVQEYADNVELVGELYKELGCYDTLFEFSNDETRLGYLESEERHHSYSAFDGDEKATVFVLSGLPGSGKDTWISKHHPDLPSVSMDDIRAEMRISPNDNQGVVVQEALSRARKLLAAKQNFVWNGTNLNLRTRGKVTQLLRNYDAKIRFLYLEISEDELWRRNRERGDEMLPHDKISKMIQGMEPPTIREGHSVVYLVDGAIPIIGSMWDERKGEDQTSAAPSR